MFINDGKTGKEKRKVNDRINEVGSIESEKWGSLNLEKLMFYRNP